MRSSIAIDYDDDRTLFVVVTTIGVHNIAERVLNYLTNCDYFIMV